MNGIFSTKHIVKTVAALQRFSDMSLLCILLFSIVVSCWNGYFVNSKISMCIQLFEPPWIPVCFCGHFYRSSGPEKFSSFVALKRKVFGDHVRNHISDLFHSHFTVFTQKQQTLNPFHTAIATRSHGRLQVGPPDPPFLMHAASVKQSPSRRGVTARSRFAL